MLLWVSALLVSRNRFADWFERLVHWAVATLSMDRRNPVLQAPWLGYRSFLLYLQSARVDIHHAGVIYGTIHWVY